MFNKYILKPLKASIVIGTLLLTIAPAYSTSDANNGHGNNCDGIDSSNRGHESPDGQNQNHNETDPNYDDEGRNNCPSDTDTDTDTESIMFAD